MAQAHGVGSDAPTRRAAMNSALYWGGLAAARTPAAGVVGVAGDRGPWVVHWWLAALLTAGADLVFLVAAVRGLGAALGWAAGAVAACSALLLVASAKVGGRSGGR